MVVPVVGLEPTLPGERDFESRASTNSATPAPTGRKSPIGFCRCQAVPEGLLLLSLGRSEDLAQDDGIPGSRRSGEKLADRPATNGTPGPGHLRPAFFDAFQGRLFRRTEGRVGPGRGGGSRWGRSCGGDGQGRRRRGGRFHGRAEEIEDAQLPGGLSGCGLFRGSVGPLSFENLLTRFVIQFRQGLVLVLLFFSLEVLPNEFQGCDDHEDQQDDGLGILKELFHLTGVAGMDGEASSPEVFARSCRRFRPVRRRQQSTHASGCRRERSGSARSP